MSRSQNAFARMERETLKKARHRSTIPDMVTIVNIIVALHYQVREARYELIQTVVRLLAAFRPLKLLGPAACLLIEVLHVYS